MLAEALETPSHVFVTLYEEMSGAVFCGASCIFHDSVDFHGTAFTWKRQHEILVTNSGILLLEDQLEKTLNRKLCARAQEQYHHRCCRDCCLCSDACVTAWKVKNPPPGVTPSANNPLSAFDVVGWSPDAPHQLASQASSTESEPAEPSCSQASEETLPPRSQVCMSSYGIPVDFHHYRQQAGQRVDRDSHLGDAERFTHICVLFEASAASQPNAAADSWQTGVAGAICHIYAKDLMVAMHSAHPVGNEKMATFLGTFRSVSRTCHPLSQE
ncbi:hypothetical protein PC129_g12674 [Phytophthora cactorum]|uniref:Uncharacterized protein n=2 Tax=Phytophthora cactorum TaxID=29920 RepID=A0A8T1HWJ2_9STRA|nr:hypothetical protein PC129_g12674 [Phytophthora cactorum]KAG4241397.1 hypothetical protein PC116_g10690 [Phytophthora cactorum]